ncbi:flagellar biosynthesis protein FliQ [Azospirillum sp. A26]|jgi:flagellar biosynthetic protein FliQ|uniref:Flagellar biosynthetic protein FliQ n=2 Tax=Azospirillum TaxID=191 RepID=A0A2B8BLV9_9PROT|nr:MULTISPECIES: flagellar biosynthesis protein FliQ [Azospirillum]MCM8739242.1 flagellar biosynthesis protein FliQ [Azospirillum sp. A1-3]PGH58528.1 flagellar biosynthetic protein FliQ [Azospirillum palustre]PWC67831.1 flagellar biosynthesis protein FliQ [Azospirillum sp. TSH7]PWC71164.1 flagellar biosynthesis protein FliQ [Azospirillum sp. TSH20]PWC87529.1 flagellar biosynthesis protein FliQ [Azospirillum sp. TSO5]
MNQADVLEVLRSGIWTTLLVAAPPLIVAVVVGVSISLVQALTQVQEMTLTFVPKIVAILVVTVLALPFMYGTLATYADRLSDLIVAID